MHSMRLADVCPVAEARLVRDGEFDGLGLLSHRDGRLLVTFYDENFLPQLQQNEHIGCVITNDSLAEKLPPRVAVAISPDPKTSFYRIHDYLLQKTNFYGAAAATQIAADAKVHPSAVIDPVDVVIGAGCEIGPRAVVLRGVTMGRDCVIGAGVVVGGEGFEPKWVGGQHVNVRHAGGVRLGNRVVLLANTHVARSVFGGNTELDDDTHVDACVHVAHNVKIGKRCEIAAGAVIAGSSTLGDDVWIGPQAMISSEIHVGDKAFVALGSVVVRDVKPGSRVFGNPAKPLDPKL